MTKREAKKFLYQVRDIVKAESRILEQIALLEVRQMATTRPLSGMPRGSTAFTIDDYISGVEDLKAKLKAELEKEQEAYLKILTILNQLEGLTKEIMIRYYLMFQTWDAVANSVGKSYRRVQTLHSQGLEKVAKILESSC